MQLAMPVQQRFRGSVGQIRLNSWTHRVGPDSARQSTGVLDETLVDRARHE